MAGRNRCWRIKKNHGCEAPCHVVAVAVRHELVTVSSGSGDESQALVFRECTAIAIRRKAEKWYARTSRTFGRVGEFWDWLRERSRPREPVTIYAHDWHLAAQLLGFWQELDAGHFNLTIPTREYIDAEGNPKCVAEWRGLLAIDDKPFIVYAVGRKGTIKLIDTRNYFDIPLPELAESFGFAGDSLRCANQDDNAARQRIELEAEVALRAMTETISAWRDGDRGNFGVTAGKCAMNNFRHEYLADYPITIDNRWFDKDGKEVTDREPSKDVGDVPNMDRELHRRCFYGGENSFWFRGHYPRPVFKIDVNSLYPYCMYTSNYPVSVLRAARPAMAGEVSPPDRPENACAHVVAYCCGDLPVRGESGKVDYPQGIFDTHLCGVELEYAARRGRIRQWIEWEEYEVAPIFMRYVEYWWKLRRQAKETSNGAQNALAKAMLNNLFGKFAARRVNWTIDGGIVPPERWGYFVAPGRSGQGFEKYRAVAGVTQRNGGSEERTDTFPAISAFVAAHGRVYMRRLRDQLPERSVLLQQTDGLIVTEEGFDEIQQSAYWNVDALGGCRLVRTLPEITVFDANHYISGDFDCLAGIPGDRIRLGDNHWRARSPFKSGDVAGMGPSAVVGVREQVYHVRGGKTVREFDQSGWSYI